VFSDLKSSAHALQESVCAIVTKRPARVIARMRCPIEQMRQRSARRREARFALSLATSALGHRNRATHSSIPIATLRAHPRLHTQAQAQAM
jgi:hypothetical protein